MAPLSVIYLNNYVGPRIRAARAITTDSAAGRKKIEDVSRALQGAGVRVFIHSFGWTTSRAVRFLAGGVELVRDGLHCEYAAILNLPLLNIVSNVISMGARVRRRVAAERASGAACRLLFYNMNIQIVLIVLYARLWLRMPVFLELEDSDHLVPMFGRARRVAFFVLQAMLRPIISGAMLVTPLLKDRYRWVPTVVCRGIAVPGVGWQERRPLSDAALVSDDGVLTVFFGGTLDEIRGADLLLDALVLADADPAFPAERIRVVITGRGSNAEKLAALCRRLRRVRAEFGGFVDDATYGRLLGEAHVALALQRPDLAFSRACFPSKVIEYMTAGLLVLTTDVADIAAFASSGVVLIDPPTPDRLVELWHSVLRDPAHYGRIAAEGQRLVLDQCSPDQVGAELVELIA